MKQHITPKQLKELTNDGRDKLREWWKPENSHLACILSTRQETFYFRLKQNKDFDKYAEEVLPLISIGQMIEFLIENAKMYYDGEINEENGEEK